MLASSPITSWQTDAETMEIVTGFIFLDSKITVDGDCSHVIKNSCSKKKKQKKKQKKTKKPTLLLLRKAMTKLYSILKSRDKTLPTKAHIVKAMVFPGVLHGCELNHKEG